VGDDRESAGGGGLERGAALASERVGHFAAEGKSDLPAAAGGGVGGKAVTAAASPRTARESQAPGSPSLE
jgi:hypothetical protein